MILHNIQPLWALVTGLHTNKTSETPQWLQAGVDVETLFLITTGHVNGTHGGVVERLFLSAAYTTALLDSTVLDRELSLRIVVIRICPGWRYLLRSTDGKRLESGHIGCAVANDPKSRKHPQRRRHRHRQCRHLQRARPSRRLRHCGQIAELSGAGHRGDARLQPSGQLCPGQWF